MNKELDKPTTETLERPQNPEVLIRNSAVRMARIRAEIARQASDGLFVRIH